MNILKNCLLVASLSVLLFIKKGDSVEVVPKDAYSEKLSSIITPEASKTLAKFIRTTKDGDSAIVNIPVDKYLTEINEATTASGSDPLQLKDQAVSVPFPPTFKIINVEISLKNGWMHGLDTLQRDGDAILLSDASTVSLTLPLKFGNLWFNYDYTLNAAPFTKSGALTGTIGNPKINVAIRFNKTTAAATLESVKVLRVKGKAVGFHHNQFLNQLLYTVNFEYFDEIVSDSTKDVFGKITDLFNDQIL